MSDVKAPDKSIMWYFHPDENIRLLRYYQRSMEFNNKLNYTPVYSSTRDISLAVIIYVNLDSKAQLSSMLAELTRQEIKNILVYNNHVISAEEIESLKEKYKFEYYIPETELWNKTEIGSIADIDVFYQGLKYGAEVLVDGIVKIDLTESLTFNLNNLTNSIKSTDCLTLCVNKTEHKFNSKFIYLNVINWTEHFPIATFNFYIENEITTYLDLWLYELAKTLAGNNKSKLWLEYNQTVDYLHSGYVNYIANKDE